uniref:Uncharacterized protein n=1 Tax=Periophthalmus magnuspinnatus TaxID=409849 RepID=A0A3B3ZG87_9GOBI
VQSQQRHISNFHHFEPDSGNISHSVTLTTKSCHQNLIVLLFEAAIVGHKSSDFLSVFDELDPHTLPDGRVGLSLHFLQDNSLGVGSSSEGVSLESGAQMSLLVLFIVPFLLTTVVTELTSLSDKSTGAGDTGLKTGAIPGK